MTNRLIPLEWQCPCGAWISAAWWRHSHMGKPAQVHSLEAMRAMRAAMEAGIAHDINPVAESLPIENYYRTGKEPMREAPNV